MSRASQVTDEDTGESTTVLLVEDQETVRGLVRQILTRRGCDVREAVDGQQALEVFEGIAEEVDLVITDVVMPNMGGAEFVAQARERRPGLRALFISGYATVDALPGYHDDPRTDFLQKPFTLADLRSKVQSLIDMGESRT